MSRQLIVRYGASAYVVRYAILAENEDILVLRVSAWPRGAIIVGRSRGHAGGRKIAALHFGPGRGGESPRGGRRTRPINLPKRHLDPRRIEHDVAVRRMRVKISSSARRAGE